MCIIFYAIIFIIFNFSLDLSNFLFYKKQQLSKENALLKQQVEIAQQQLIALELSHGKKQIALPNTRSFSTEVPSTTIEVNLKSDLAKAPEVESSDKKQAKKKKPKKKKTNENTITNAPAELSVDVGRPDMRVG